MRRDFLADDPHRGLERGHFRVAVAHVAQLVLGVVALHIDHHAIGQRKAIAVERGGKGLFLGDAAGDHRIDFGIFGLDGRFAAVQEWNFPIASRAGPLAADDELVRFAGTFIDRIGDDRGHDRPHETDAHHHDDFLPFLSGRP